MFGKKYPVPITAWCNNWGNLTTFFRFDTPLHKGNLYHQFRGRVPRASQKSNQNKGCIYLCQCPFENGIPGRTENF